jgi:hypothetical protein
MLRRVTDKQETIESQKTERGGTGMGKGKRPKRMMRRFEDDVRDMLFCEGGSDENTFGRGERT